MNNESRPDGSAPRNGLRRKNGLMYFINWIPTAKLCPAMAARGLYIRVDFNLQLDRPSALERKRERERNRAQLWIGAWILNETLTRRCRYRYFRRSIPRSPRRAPRSLQYPRSDGNDRKHAYDHDLLRDCVSLVKLASGGISISLSGKSRSNNTKTSVVKRPIVHGDEKNERRESSVLNNLKGQDSSARIWI